MRELGNNVLTIADGVTELQINQQGKRILSLVNVVFAASDTRYPLDQECRQAAQRLHKERQEAVDWLTQLNFSSKQIDVFSQHQEGTGAWFLEGQAFKRWRDGNERVLWCPGLREQLLGSDSRVFLCLLTVHKLGQVKLSLRKCHRCSTRSIAYMIRSAAIDHLQRTFPTSNVGIAFLYCNYKEQEQQTLINFVASLLQQLVGQQSLVPDEVCSLWEEHRRGRTPPGLVEISKLFQSIASVFSSIFIVIDALDECSEVTRNYLIAEINKLPQNLHLMVTSRHNASIEQLFSGSVRLEILATDGDVKAYVCTQIDRRERLKKFVQADPSLQEKIETRIADKAQGMFVLTMHHF